MRRWLPVIGLLLALTHLPVVSQEANNWIQLRSGTLLGPAHDAGLAGGLRLSVEQLASAGGAALLKFDAPVTPAARESLAASGARWVAPLGATTALVVVPAGGIERIANTPGLAWAAPYHPGLRIAPEVAAVTAAEPHVIVPLILRLFTDSDVGEIAARVEELGLPVRGSSAGRLAQGRLGDRSGRLVLTPTAEQVVLHRETIAKWPEVLWIGRRPFYRLANDAAAWVGQSGLEDDEQTPVYDHGLFGDGQVVGVFDTGLDADMCFFEDPSLGLPPVNEGFGVGSPDPAQRKVLIVDFLWSDENPSDPTQWDTHGHGTHVAGTVAGDNLVTPSRRDGADGMAPAAKLVFQDSGYDGNGPCSDLAALGCETAELLPYFDQAYQQGARIHSNSWVGTDDELAINAYNHFCEDADEFVWNHPEFLILFAAGNVGGESETVSSPSTAKNVVSVGASGSGYSAGEVASFSSRGPTEDGRIKPDVTAPGVGIVSASNDGDVTTGNCGETSMNGTSMATPAAAGLAALAREYFEKGYYPSGAANSVDALVPSAALLRAGLIASAKSMGRADSAPPSDDQGWGRILLDDLLYFPGDSRHLFVAELPDRFDSPTNPADIHEIEILDGSQPLKIVISWTDYPSTPLASVNLVNDLDLIVTSPGGTVYLGNAFSEGVSQPGGSPDRLNNVEVIRIEHPESGMWTIQVSPYAIPQPSQGYALVVTGRVPVAGVGLERTVLTIDDAAGGDGDGRIEPGEWIDLPLALRNVGDAGAGNVSVGVESLSAHVDVSVADVVLPDLAPGSAGASTPAQLQIQAAAELPCTDSILLRFTYRADGYERSETTELPTGTRSVILRDDFEGPTGWAHLPAETTATRGDWVIGDPVGTTFQPEDDVTPDPGVNCLYTAPNPTGNTWIDEVANGVVVARSGAYDLSGHPEARLTLWRWFVNSETGNDPEDYFRLHIREDSGSPDVLLEDLGNSFSDHAWRETNFRVADFVPTGPAVELRVAASDGYNQGATIEAAIDEIVFWEPVCDTWRPVPNPVIDLGVDRTGGDLSLSWSRPAADPQHGAATNYRIYRSQIVSSGFVLQAESTDSGENLDWVDSGAAGAGSPSLFAYEIISANAAGDGELLP